MEIFNVERRTKCDKLVSDGTRPPETKKVARRKNILIFDLSFGPTETGRGHFVAEKSRQPSAKVYRRESTVGIDHLNDLR